MKLEYERKFLVKNLPEDFKYTDKFEIEQCYLNDRDDSIEIRIRKYDDGRHYLDFKKDGGIERMEIFSEKITYEQYIQLKKAAKYKLTKTRYKNYSYSLCLYVDVFHNKDLILAEIESTTPENNLFVDEYNGETWFEREVTGEDQYKNRNIAS
jgi:CYTH domain-containing protein